VKKLLQVMPIIASCYLNSCLASSSLGDVADNLVYSVAGLGRIIHAISYVAGVGFFLGGILQYKFHWENPQQVKISTPIFLVVIGLSLIGLPFLTMWSDSSSFLR
jgi:hypothetical protein